MPTGVIAHVAAQLGVPAATDLSPYRVGDARWDHAAEIRQRFGYRDFTDQPEHFRLAQLHPRPYKLLFDVVQANPESRPRLIRGYLDGYYKQSRGAYWWGSHELGSPYVGYWCFEVAAFVKKLGIDDSAFADNPYYPRDIVKASPAAIES